VIIYNSIQVTPKYSEIGFHLHFFDSNTTSYIDQGVRFEYEGDRGWRPIHYYTPSLLQSPKSAVTLNNDNISVTARFIYYEGRLPLHVVYETKPVLYREYISTSSNFRLRWTQLYSSIDLQQDAASWLIDNITVIQWDGQCTRTLSFEDFENSTCARYALPALIVFSKKLSPCQF
jgi:hypothetical protein